jgi:hypothetical protein
MLYYKLCPKNKLLQGNSIIYVKGKYILSPESPDTFQKMAEFPKGQEIGSPVFPPFSDFEFY